MMHGVHKVMMFNRIGIMAELTVVDEVPSDMIYKGGSESSGEISRRGMKNDRQYGSKKGDFL